MAVDFQYWHCLKRTHEPLGTLKLVMLTTLLTLTMLKAKMFTMTDVIILITFSVTRRKLKENFQ